MCLGYFCEKICRQFQKIPIWLHWLNNTLMDFSVESYLLAMDSLQAQYQIKLEWR